MLYELLTGVLPGEEVLRPGRRLLALGAAEAKAVAADRGTVPAALARALSGDLDWIVMKALAPEPAARYASAAPAPPGRRGKRRARRRPPSR